MKSKITALLFAAWATAVLSNAADDQTAKIKSVVDGAVRSTMLNYSIPGMAVGLTLTGKDYVFNYGLASRETKKPVTDGTLFELGSISKTFTATLASYAQVCGNLSLHYITLISRENWRCSGPFRTSEKSRWRSRALWSHSPYAADGDAYGAKNPPALSCPRFACTAAAGSTRTPQTEGTSLLFTSA